MSGRSAEEEHGGTVVTPSAEFPPLDPAEVDTLRRVGAHWPTGAPPALPVDPTLDRYRSSPAPGRFSRLAPIALFRPEQAERAGQAGRVGQAGRDGRDGLVAAAPASPPDSRLGRRLARVRRVLLGPPLTSAAVLHERMRKLVALPVLSSDLLSSVAYGPEALLTVLVLAGSGALGLALPLSAALVLLMVAVGISYRQTIPAYPHGAGSYLVAGDNLGVGAGLTAAAGLMLDYVLTVSVSIAAGMHAITSALPGLTPFTVPLGALVILLLLAGNLRGVRTAGNIFVLPTYAFVAALSGLLVVGYLRAAGRGFVPVAPPAVPATQGLGLLLVLRAFASGAVSMTGIEAVSNAVPAFRPTEWRNARTTLAWMVAMLVVLFAGLTLLIHLTGLVPRPGETLLSQLARVTFPTGPWYAVVQATTALILLLAANTAFNDFPRLLFFMARAGHAPRRFLHLGDRLAFGNGLVALAGTAIVVFVAFGGHTEKLIPLYAVGVFLAFTLSQSGMVVHWRRHRGRLAASGACQRGGRGPVRSCAADRGGGEVHRGGVGGGGRRTAAGAALPPGAPALPHPARRPGPATPAGRAGARGSAVRGSALRGAVAVGGGRAGRGPAARRSGPRCRVRRGGGGAAGAAAPGGGPGGTAQPGVDACPGVRGVAGPADAGGAPRPGGRRGGPVPGTVAGLGGPRPAGDDRLAVPGGDRAVGALPGRVARRRAGAGADRGGAGGGAAPAVAPPAAQPYRATAAQGVAGAARRGGDKHPGPPRRVERLPDW